MLGFELYLKNKDSGEIPKTLKPFKKIFFNKSLIQIDQNPREYFGNKESRKHLVLQNYLSMPLNFGDSKKINLPDKRTGTMSKNPYLEIFCSFSISRKKEKTITLSIGKEPQQYKATYDIDSDKQNITTNSDISLKIDMNNYQIGGLSLYDEYVNSGIITINGVFNVSNFKNICDVFFNYVKTRKDHIATDEPIKPISFSLFVLPNNNEIIYISKQTGSTNFKDSFGNDSTAYASTPTKTAKFLSYDDPAFTLNLTKGEQFYRNLGIGNKSLDKINIPVDVFNISGLSWLFIELESKSIFEQTNLGIYAQLYKNYEKIKKNTDDENSQMKIVCYKKNQAKLEILIDENMTMYKMKKIFESVKENKIQSVAFEVLIDSTKTTTLWNEYLKAVRCLITGTGFDRRLFINYLTYRLRQKIHEWLKDKGKGRDYFTRSDFCLQTLSTTGMITTLVQQAEEYAYKIGRIAGTYVSFKEKAERNNSLRDILTYSKYDREKIRFVYNKIGQGINLAKEKKEQVDRVSDYVRDNTPTFEIDDVNAHDDYSYFFYKGVFETLGGN